MFGVSEESKIENLSTTAVASPQKLGNCGKLRAVGLYSEEPVSLSGSSCPPN